MIISTDKLTDLVVKKLRQNRSSRLEVAFHMGKVDSDLRASTIRRMIVDRKSKRFMFDRSYLNSFALKFSEDPYFSDSLYRFVDHLYRSNMDIAIKANNIEYIHESYDYFYLAFDFIAGLIDEYKIDHILFFNVPHLGYDTVCYEVAHFLGLKTTILSQSIFPGKYFSTTSADYFGNFKINIDCPDIYKINKSHLPDLFYMKGINSNSTPAKGVSIFGFLSVVLYVIIREPLLLVRFDKLFKLISRVNQIYRRMPKWRDPFAKFFNRRSLDYFEFIAGLQSVEVDFKSKYVYFPLHLQPEMTTSALGGAFVDQALAIEILSSILPDNVKIYVKENPKQMGFMRGPTFFHRINRLKNVELIPENINSHELIRNCIFVAAITGTAGWEAISIGKPALVFGNAWYRSLPGAVKYSKGLTYDEIISIKISHASLEKAVGQLQSSMHDGVIDRHYKALVPGYDNDSNVLKIADTIENLICNNHPYTFDKLK
jgi:hypothetical protein